MPFEVMMLVILAMSLVIIIGGTAFNDHLDAQAEKPENEKSWLGKMLT